MRLEMLNLLSCPDCKRAFNLVPFKKESSHILEGLLYCSCGRGYPIVGSIPRILSGAFVLYGDFTEKHKEQISKYVLAKHLSEGSDLKDLKKRTQASFGYQWTSFYQMSCDFRENFLNYIYPVSPEFFPGKLGLDIGCGFGRHIFNAAKFGARMVGIDFSQAIESSRRNTQGLDNVYLSQADIYNLPFTDNTFDFVYSIGVLHHLPDPGLGFRSLIRLIKPKGSIFIWVYSDQRKWAVRIIELARKITTRLPLPLLKAICFLAALVDYCIFILPFKSIKRSEFISKRLKKIFPRSFVYSQYPFQVDFADWFDRLAAPVRFYYNAKDMQDWFERAGLVNIKVSPTGLYGWRAYGEKRGESK